VARLALHFCEIVLTVVHSVADGPKLGENVVDTASQKQENLEAHAPMRWRQPAGHHTADANHRAKKALWRGRENGRKPHWLGNARLPPSSNAL